MDSEGEDSSANPPVEVNPESARYEEIMELPQNKIMKPALYVELSDELGEMGESSTQAAARLFRRRLAEYYKSERSADVPKVELPHQFECLKNQQTQAADDVIEPEADHVPAPDLDSSSKLPIAGMFAPTFKPRFSKRAAGDVIDPPTKRLKDNDQAAAENDDADEHPDERLN